MHLEANEAIFKRTEGLHLIKCARITELRCRCAKANPISLSSWRKFFNIWLICGLRPFYVSLPAVVNMPSVLWRLHYRACCVHDGSERSEFTPGRQMRQCLLVYAVFRGLSMLSTLYTACDGALRLDCFRTHCVLT